MSRRPHRRAAIAALAAAVLISATLIAGPALPSPEQFLGFRPGADYKLARFDRIADYMKQAAGASDRVRVRELGRTDGGHPFLVVEISAPDTLKNLDRYQQLERKLYLQGGVPSPRDRDDIFRRGKAVVLITCSVHANEIGATQASLELVHQLATDNSAATRKILDNVIVLLVPSANPDGQILVTDWYNKNVGTPYENSPMPYLYHPYAGHDINRDMYMLTQKETQFLARLAWRDWFPAVWLDQHQMGLGGARMFVMPGADPINPNVHPLIYRWNTILGQSQAAALEDAGKIGILHGAMFSSYWQGALAWSGWWHNQLGVLTEAASVWVASPVDQLHAGDGAPRQPAEDVSGRPSGTHAAPTDLLSRSAYPRPWTGGRWTLRDIVDYELITTNALLQTVADRRETLLRQLYDVNLQTLEQGRSGSPSAILIPVQSQQDPGEAVHLVEQLQAGGVDVFRADTALTSGGREFPAGTYVVPMAQVFGRYAKDLLEKQTYPQIRVPGVQPPETPYDTSAWSLGMLMGVDVAFAREPLDPGVKLSRATAPPALRAEAADGAAAYGFDYTGPDSAIAINRLVKAGAHVSFDQPSHLVAVDAPREILQGLARDLGLRVSALGVDGPLHGPGVRVPRIGLYASWTANMDEGWTRWVLEHYEFPLTTIHNADILAGNLRGRFDAIILPDQAPRELVDGYRQASIRPEYRGGIGRDGAVNLDRFVLDGGTLIALGAACDFVIDRLPIPVRNLKANLRRDRHSGPGTILRLQVDTTGPLGFGMARDTFGFYTNGPFFTMPEGSRAASATVVARYPEVNVLASGWLLGEELMAGRAAVVSVDVNPGRVVLFGIRPQHRGQTHATFPLLFNALYLAASGSPAPAGPPAIEAAH